MMMMLKKVVIMMMMMMTMIMVVMVTISMMTMMTMMRMMMMMLTMMTMMMMLMYDDNEDDADDYYDDDDYADSDVEYDDDGDGHDGDDANDNVLDSAARTNVRPWTIAFGMHAQGALGPPGQGEATRETPDARRRWRPRGAASQPAMVPPHENHGRQSATSAQASGGTMGCTASSGSDWCRGARGPEGGG